MPYAAVHRTLFAYSVVRKVQYIEPVRSTRMMLNRYWRAKFFVRSYFTHKLSSVQYE
jgi:hypothetical protein